jgi:signal transduction histidine kinase
MRRISWITWRTYFLSLPVNVIVLMFSADHKVESFQQVFIWGVIALLSHLFLAPFIFLIINLYKIELGWKFDLTSLIGLGAIRGIAITYLATKFDVELTVSSTYKILNSILAVPQWFIAISIFIESRRQFQREFRKLFVKAMDNQARIANKRRLLPGKLSAADEAINKLQYLTSSLVKDLHSMKSLSGDLQDYSKKTLEIDNFIEKDLKPESRKLWESENIKVPKVKLGELLKISIFQIRLRVPEVVLMSIPYYLIGIHADANLKTTLFQSALLITNDLTVYFMCEALHRYARLSRPMTNLTILIFIPLLGFLSQKYLVPIDFQIIKGSFQFWTFELFMSITFFILVMILNSQQVLSKHRFEIIQSLESLLLDKNMEKVIDKNLEASTNRNIAEYIHGEVQAGLIASSILLQKAADSKDSDLAQEALERAAGLLDQDHTSLYYTRMASPEKRLEKIKVGWAGIADVQIGLPEVANISPETLRSAVALIEESVNNAIRHSAATSINVSGILKKDTLTISIISDGEYLSKGKSGLGTQLFDDLSEDWYFGKDGEFSKLVFVLSNQ